MSELCAGVQTVHRALDYHLERHNVIASNIANVDTPGFSPLELLRADRASGAQRSMRVARTDEAHLSTHGTGPGGEIVRIEDPTVRPGNDGNSVTLEREMSKLAANDIRFDGAARIVKRQLAMLRYAANGGMPG